MNTKFNSLRWKVGYNLPSSIVGHPDVLKGEGKTLTLKPVFPIRKIIKL